MDWTTVYGIAKSQTRLSTDKGNLLNTCKLLEISRGFQSNKRIGGLQIILETHFSSCEDNTGKTRPALLCFFESTRWLPQ